MNSLSLHAMAAAVALLAAAAVAQPASTPTASAPAASAPSPTPAAATPPRDALRLMEAWLEAQMVYERLPSLSAAVVLGQQTVWHQAWGHADHRRQVPARTDTAYSICSISKLFTSVAVMQLWEAGKLALDEDIGKLLPDFKLQRTDPDSGPITVRGLLTHASGMPREADFGYWTAPEFQFPSRSEMLQAVAGQRTVGRAFDRQQYSNLGMSLLGELVASASGQSYEAYVQNHILGPLKLNDTRPGMPAALWGTGLAQGHGALTRQGTRPAFALFDPRALTPAAGFSSTVDDLARFAAWQFRLRKNGGSELLRVSTLREMQRVQWTDPDGENTWGLGFAVYRDGTTNIASHTGVCPGYLSSIALALNEEIAVVSMFNATGGAASRLTTGMRKLLQKGLKLPPAPATGPALDDYTGRYDGQPFSSELLISPWGKDLAVLYVPSPNPAGNMYLLRHAAGDNFRAVRDDGSLGTEYRFERDATGRVSGFVAVSQRAHRLPR